MVKYNFIGSMEIKLGKVIGVDRYMFKDKADETIDFIDGNLCKRNRNY